MTKVPEQSSIAGTEPTGLSLFLFLVNSRRPNNTYSAASSVATGVSSTFVDLDLTAGPSEAGLAGTGVAALTGVATSGSIHAGLVVSAVVEIWKDTATHVD